MEVSLAAPSSMKRLIEARLRDREAASQQGYADKFMDATEEYLKQCAHFEQLGADNPVAIAALAKLKLAHVETLAVLGENHKSEIKALRRLHDTLLPSTCN